MDDKDYAELIAWRFAFDHLGDGTPDGAAKAISAKMDTLEREALSWRQVSESDLRLAQNGSVFELTK